MKRMVYKFQSQLVSRFQKKTYFSIKQWQSKTLFQGYKKQMSFHQHMQLCIDARVGMNAIGEIPYTWVKGSQSNMDILII